ncbi:MAG: DUF4007 family protein [Deltaproteobacteria bacterium]|nr:DUF4007 family protein [Deltaproteobacteria bacterium]
MGLAAIDRPAFGGHETFPLRYTWLRKALDGVTEDPQLFVREDALVRLGVGKNMVRSMRHWGLAAGVLAEPEAHAERRAGFVETTNFGRALLADDGWDPYLEDPGTLWILHWRIASTPSMAATWFYVFGEFAERRFTRAGLVDRLLALAKERKWPKVSQASLKRDVDTFVRSYVPPSGARQRHFEDQLDSPLAELGLITEREPGTYEIQRGPQPTLPDEVFAYALNEFLRRRGQTTAKPVRRGAPPAEAQLGLLGRDEAKTLPAERLHFEEGSPGRTFALDAAGLFSRLERLQDLTEGALSFDSTAGLSQVYVHNLLDPQKLLTRYYRGLTA